MAKGQPADDVLHVYSTVQNAYRPGDPRAFDTRVFESAMDEFIGKDEAFVEQRLVLQGLEKLLGVLKGMFSQF